MTYRSLYYADEPSVSIAQVKEIILDQQQDHRFTASEQLRTAVWYLPLIMPVALWVAACKELGIHEGTARNRFREARRTMEGLP